LIDNVYKKTKQYHLNNSKYIILILEFRNSKSSLGFKVKELKIKFRIKELKIKIRVRGFKIKSSGLTNSKHA